MRKIFVAILMATFAVAGLSTAASATTLPHSGGVNCAWAHSDPTCPTTQPGTPGGCTPTSFAGGGCVTDTLSFTSRTRGHDRDHEWGNRNQDPCVFHQHQGWQSQDRFQNTTDIRGCRCETVKIWHTKTVCIHGRNVEIRYFTTQVICKHQHDPQPCGCQHGGLVTLGITRAA